MGNYVYKYVYEDEIVYIGKTKDLLRRVYQHALEKKFQKYKNADIYYCELANPTMSDVVESELIRIYKPELNIAKKSNWDGLKFTEPEWHLFSIDEWEKKKELELKKKKELPQYVVNLGRKYWCAIKIDNKWEFSAVQMTKGEMEELAKEFTFHSGEVYERCFMGSLAIALSGMIVFDKDLDALAKFVAEEEEKEANG